MLEVIEGLPEDEREVFDLVGIQGCSTSRPLISFEDVESPFPPRNQTWKQTFWTGTREPNSYPYP